MRHRRDCGNCWQGICQFVQRRFDLFECFAVSQVNRCVQCEGSYHQGDRRNHRDGDDHRKCPAEGALKRNISVRDSPAGFSDVFRFYNWLVQVDQSRVVGAVHSPSVSRSRADLRRFAIREAGGGLWVSWYQDGRLWLGPSSIGATTWAVRDQAELVAQELGRHHDPLSFCVEEVTT